MRQPHEPNVNGGGKDTRRRRRRKATKRNGKGGMRDPGSESASFRPYLFH